MLLTMGWRLFPVWLITAMLMVAAVNGYMVYAAVHSFPGEAGTDGFDLSNDYDKVLKTATRQAAFGWHIRLTTDPARHAKLRLAGAAGQPLAQAQIEATAERPVGPAAVTALRFQADNPVTPQAAGDANRQAPAAGGGNQHNPADGGNHHNLAGSGNQQDPAAGGGSFTAREPLPSGQWDILLTVRAEGQTYTTTRRLTVP